MQAIMTDKIWINKAGEAVTNEPPPHAKHTNKFSENPFVKLSDQAISNWSNDYILASPKTWKETLSPKSNKTTQSIKEAQEFSNAKQELFLQDFINTILPPVINSQANDSNSKYIPLSTKDVRLQIWWFIFINLCVFLFVSKISREDLKQIKSKFEELLKYRCARSNGIDFIRSQLSFQLFDELIRQVIMFSIILI